MIDNALAYKRLRITLEGYLDVSVLVVSKYMDVQMAWLVNDVNVLSTCQGYVTSEVKKDMKVGI